MTRKLSIEESKTVIEQIKNLEQKGFKRTQIAKVLGVSGPYVTQVLSNFQSELGMSKKMAKMVLARDNGRCQLGRVGCQINETIKIIHIDADDKNNNLNNLLSVCDCCLYWPVHNKKTKYANKKEVK